MWCLKRHSCKLPYVAVCLPWTAINVLNTLKHVFLSTVHMEPWGAIIWNVIHYSEREYDINSEHATYIYDVLVFGRHMFLSFSVCLLKTAQKKKTEVFRSKGLMKTPYLEGSPVRNLKTEHGVYWTLLENLRELSDLEMWRIPTTII